MSEIKDFLHPIWRSSLSKYGEKENIDFLSAVQAPLTQAQKDILNNKIQLYLKTAQAHWLDYWGMWLGLRRNKSESDDDFRARLLSHVTHGRNTVEAIRKAVADFIKTNEENVYIYEPFRDMFIWNSSYYNTLKYFPSSYYDYAIIDIHIDASFPPEVVEIINLFRPAGVIWVLTDDVNGVDPDVTTIDFRLDTHNLIEDDFWEYAGWYQIETYRITTFYNDNPVDGNVFIWNEDDWNNGGIYYKGSDKFDTVATIGQLYQDYTPLNTDEYNDTRPYSDQRTVEENSILANADGNGVAFTLQPPKSNLVVASNPNLLSDVDPASLVTSYSKTGWVIQSGGNGTGNINLLNDSTMQAIHYFSIIGNTTGNRDFEQLISLEQGTYTFSVYARLNSSAGVTSKTLLLRLWDNTTNTQYLADTSTIVTSKTDWVRATWTMDLTKIDSTHEFIVCFGIGGMGSIDFTQPKLEKGSVATDWLDNPNLISTNSYKVALSSSSTGYQLGFKGYANQDDKNAKLTATLSNEVLDSSFNPNLAVGTTKPLVIKGSNSENQIDSSVNYLFENSQTVSDLFAKYGKSFVLSYDWSITGDNIAGKFQIQLNSDPWGIGDGKTVSSAITSGHNTIQVTFTKDPSTATGLSYRLDDFQGTLTISNLKFEAGTKATPWSPNAADNYTLDSVVIQTEPSTNPSYYSAVLPSAPWLKSVDLQLSLVTDNKDTKFSFDYLSVRPTTDTNPMYYSIRPDEDYTMQGLTVIYDIKQFLMRFSSHATSQLSPSFIDGLFPNKNFVINAKVPGNLGSLTVTPYIYNFNLSMWVKLSDIALTNEYVEQDIPINSLIPYLNSNCILFIKLVPETVQPISVDYLGLSLSNPVNAAIPVLNPAQGGFEVGITAV